MQPQVANRMTAGATSSTDVVWDPLVRVAHWTIAAGFFVAYFTEDDALTLHVWAGYTVGVVVLLRIVWGFVGPEHARFSDFLYRPSEVAAYLRDLLSFRAKRYLGHSPAGGAMVLILLVGLAATVGSGLVLYAIEENAGPLAGIVTSANRPEGAATVSGQREAEDDDAEVAEAEGSDGSGELWEEVHEVAANLTLVLVCLHVVGVLLASFVHRENLARAMVTGRKRPL
jgi:cytochrome b